MEDVYNEIKRLEPFAGMDEDVTFYLQINNGERLSIGDSDYKGIRISKQGQVSKVK